MTECPTDAGVAVSRANGRRNGFRSRENECQLGIAPMGAGAAADGGIPNERHWNFILYRNQGSFRPTRVGATVIVRAAEFRRGDGNSDGKVDLQDAIRSLEHIFLGAGPPECLDAADTNRSHPPHWITVDPLNPMAQVDRTWRVIFAAHAFFTLTSPTASRAALALKRALIGFSDGEFSRHREYDAS